MSSFTHIPIQLWMLQSKEIRAHIAKTFNLQRTGVTEIRDNELLTDGYCTKDLSEITAEKMAAYVGSNEDFPRLWELTVAKTRYELNPPVEVKHHIPVEDADLPEPETTHVEKRKRPKKSA
jgi:hypothetical protein